MNARENASKALVEEVVRSIGAVRLRVLGTSMVPAMLPGDLVSIRRASLDEISVGEVVLFLQNGRLFVHRVVGRNEVSAAGNPEGHYLITRGDRLRHDDPPVSSRELLGRVVSIERDNRNIELAPHGSNGLFARLLRASDRATYLYLRLGACWRTLFFWGPMPGVTAVTESCGVVVEIGGLPIRLRCADRDFICQIEERYAGFLSSSTDATFDFEIELAPKDTESGDDDLRVAWDSGRWLMERGDFRAEWNPSTARGRIQQTINPYSLDSVLRIVHTLLLARKGGFLLHASSAIRNGRAFLFSGVSGAGKTTMARLAPSDAALLTDEISYVIRRESSYFAVGTPFFGELARPGENLQAPIEALYLLAKGPENKIEPIEGAAAVRGLLGNILFFARDPEFVKLIFDAACEFVNHVPVRRLTFVPDASVWELIV
jgi:signal peptidase I